MDLIKKLLTAFEVYKNQNLLQCILYPPPPRSPSQLLALSAAQNQFPAGRGS